MRHDSLDAFLTHGRPHLPAGPVAVIYAEDLVEVESTILHHLNLKFPALILLAPPELDLPADIEGAVFRIDHPTSRPQGLVHAVNAMMAEMSGRWMYYCYNAEYLFYPFCETRTVSDLLAFHEGERRDAMLSYVIDLYAADLDRHPNAVCVEEASLDASGYYALARPDEKGEPRLRQLDFFGGLRWRFEEHIPAASRTIDRISIFRARRGLRLRPGFTFSDEEYNTYACPWHNNVTAAVCSFRTAKALRTNPGSAAEVRRLKWHNTKPFSWQSRQLLDLGLIEPGQWF